MSNFLNDRMISTNLLNLLNILLNNGEHVLR
jgi:hypothetical protein